MNKLKSFKSNVPPALVELENGTFIVPGWIEVPNGTTLDEVYSVCEISKPANGPGMYCSTEELIAYKNGTYESTKNKNTESISEQVKSSDGSKTYAIIFNNGVWACDCVGFSFRKRCKHVDEIKSKQKTAA
ncbi:MAG: hypothetical protein WC979_00265 [Candidatus Pacearchaeota archaeon]|jgi:hypothetical protein|nr:hypothetical protein [Clostridia bacterium]